MLHSRVGLAVVIISSRISVPGSLASILDGSSATGMAIILVIPAKLYPANSPPLGEHCNHC